MDFFTAVIHVKGGGKVSREEWTDKSAYVLFKGNVLHIFNNGQFHNWIVSRDDVDATDWLDFETN